MSQSKDDADKYWSSVDKRIHEALRPYLKARYPKMVVEALRKAGFDIVKRPFSPGEIEDRFYARSCGRNRGNPTAPQEY